MTIFGIIHMSLASNTIKNIFIKNWVPEHVYRLFFNGISIILFLTIILFTPRILFIGFDLFQLDFVPMVLAAVFLFFGGVIIVSSVLTWYLPGFIGIRQVKEPILYQSGIYALARHPIYTGIILFHFGLVIIEFSAITMAWLLGNIFICFFGSIHEESLLKTTFSQYQQYQQRVGRFFPLTLSHWNYFFSNRVVNYSGKSGQSLNR